MKAKKIHTSLAVSAEDYKASLCLEVRNTTLLKGVEHEPCPQTHSVSYVVRNTTCPSPLHDMDILGNCEISATYTSVFSKQPSESSNMGIRVFSPFKPHSFSKHLQG